MNKEATKMHLEIIDDAFSSLKKNVRELKPLSIIERELGIIFQGKFTIQIVVPKQNDLWSVMSMYPEKRTLDKIIESVVREDSPSVLKTIWEKNTSWIIEIDRRTIDDSIIPISNRELTALLLHEIGHVKESQSIPVRISKVMKYQFSTLSTRMKMILKHPAYQKMLILPVVDSSSIYGSMTPSGVNHEIKADAYAVKFGYKEEIATVLSKIIQKSSSVALDADGGMSKVMEFITTSIDDLSRRRGKIALESFQCLRNLNASPFIESVFSDIFENVFYLSGNYMESTDSALSYTKEQVSDILKDYEDGYYCEVFGLKKKLKPIKQQDLDYIAVEVERIRTYNDKILTMSYIRSKLDALEYYISIVKNDKFSRKIEVPHTLEYLEAYKEKMERLLRIAMDVKVEPPYHGLTIQYPAGYEG